MLNSMTSIRRQCKLGIPGSRSELFQNSDEDLSKKDASHDQVSEGDQAATGRSTMLSRTSRSRRNSCATAVQQSSSPRQGLPGNAGDHVESERQSGSLRRRPVGIGGGQV